MNIELLIDLLIKNHFCLLIYLTGNAKVLAGKVGGQAITQSCLTKRFLS